MPPPLGPSHPDPMARPATVLLRWYDKHRRELPWRAARSERADPYRVWLSEIMLQQTTVAAVIPYYEGFLARWPDVGSLAAAEDVDVMRAWAGLGYYARARNLLSCARRVAFELDGRFPDTEESLRALPGIGAYTAAAIAAIAFERRAVVVDGNVERVVSRLFAIKTPLPQSRPEIRRRADELTPQRRPGDFAQAMMDLGATICTPRQPACMICPLNAACEARRMGRQLELPRRAAKAARPSQHGAVFVGMRADGAILLRTRPATGLLGGMTDFPGRWDLGDTDPLDAAPFPADWQAIGAVTHGFTHFDLRLDVYRAAAAPGAHPADLTCRWVTPGDLEREAFPTLMRKVAAVAGLDRPISADPPHAPACGFWPEPGPATDAKTKAPPPGPKGPKRKSA